MDKDPSLRPPVATLSRLHAEPNKFARHRQHGTASLGALHQPFRNIAAEGKIMPASGWPLATGPRHTIECHCETCERFGSGIFAQRAALAGDAAAADRLSAAVMSTLIERSSGRER